LRGRLKNQAGVARGKQGRSACSAFLSVAAPRVKNKGTARLKGDDADKKISGVKRHLAVDTQGLPRAIAVTTAAITDRQGALLALTRCKATLKPARSILVDSTYTGRPFAQGVSAILGQQIAVQIAKRHELHTFKVRLTRWIVACGIAWLKKNRRLRENCE